MVRQQYADFVGRSVCQAKRKGEEHVILQRKFEFRRKSKALSSPELGASKKKKNKKIIKIIIIIKHTHIAFSEE